MLFLTFFSCLDMSWNYCGCSRIVKNVKCGVGNRITIRSNICTNITYWGKKIERIMVENVYIGENVAQYVKC